jgi:tRNA(Arg) A34 adenosine deaminase TadA
MKFKNHMQIALEEAKEAGSRGEIPVGAAVVSSKGVLISRSGNQTRALADPSAHAEMLAIREACKILNSERIPDCDLYVTLEPCAMCAGLISNSRIRRLYFGAADSKSGAVLHGPRVFEHAQCHHKPEVYDSINITECEKLLKEFFKALR